MKIYQEAHRNSGRPRESGLEALQLNAMSTFHCWAAQKDPLPLTWGAGQMPTWPALGMGYHFQDTLTSATASESCRPPLLLFPDGFEVCLLHVTHFHMEGP